MVGIKKSNETAAGKAPNYNTYKYMTYYYRFL